MRRKNSTNILLETGNNELEILEFNVNGVSYGINIAKVNIILKYEEVSPMPNTADYIEGVINQRGNIITVVDLAKYMDVPPSGNLEDDIIIIASFNDNFIAFHVHGVNRICRISWEDIEKPDGSVYGTKKVLTTGIAKFENRLITMLDFEYILAQVKPSVNKEYTEATGEIYIDKTIVVIEDSIFFSQLLVNNLRKKGFINIQSFPDGKSALDYINTLKENEKDVYQALYCVITDIEMPVMDGHTFIKKVREELGYIDLPIIGFSSISLQSEYEKTIQLGAREVFTKNNMDNLVEYVCNICKCNEI